MLEETISQNTNKAAIGESGNSNVDVNIDINIDTTAIAYAMLCSLYATEQLNEKQLDKAIDRFESLIKRREKNLHNKKEKVTKGESRPMLFGVPKSTK
jgi:hypothetical protein